MDALYLICLLVGGFFVLLSIFGGANSEADVDADFDADLDADFDADADGDLRPLEREGEPEFVSGGITADAKEVRDKAIRFIKEAKEFATEMQAPRVTCCPLGDGFEFPFQVEYQTMWKRLADAFGETVEYEFVDQCGCGGYVTRAHVRE